MKAFPAGALVAVFSLGLSLVHAQKPLSTPDQSAQQLWDATTGGGSSTAASSAQQGPAAASVFGGGEGVNGTIYAVAVQPDGKIVIGGQFNLVNTVPRTNLARLNADGTLDRTFLETPLSGVNGTVYALAIDGNGGILVGGDFNEAATKPRKNFVRYMPNGQLDSNFDEGQGPDGTVQAIALQPDGKIVIGGQFIMVSTDKRTKLARLNADSTLDGPLTKTDEVTGQVLALGSLTDGNVVAAGMFEVAGQIGRNILNTANTKPE
jgi:uncharacterized delta-60 repeat protein